eukprot:2639781-Rhodomonas_salina.1
MSKTNLVRPPAPPRLRASAADARCGGWGAVAAAGGVEGAGVPGQRHGVRAAGHGQQPGGGRRAG